MKNFIEPIVVVVSGTIIVFSLIYCLRSEGCESYSDITGRETIYSFSGCYVKHDGEWYSKEEYKFIALKGK